MLDSNNADLGTPTSTQQPLVSLLLRPVCESRGLCTLYGPMNVHDLLAAVCLSVLLFIVALRLAIRYVLPELGTKRSCMVAVALTSTLAAEAAWRSATQPPPAAARLEADMLSLLYKSRCAQAASPSRMSPAEDGAVLINQDFYVKVHRRSMYGQYTEPYRAGWWHFAALDSKIFLKVGRGRVMDYTCPAWVTCAGAERLEVVHIEATKACFFGCPLTIYWGSTQLKAQFTRGFDAWCREGWCVPHTCLNATFERGPTAETPSALNNPAHLKADPTFHQHGLRQHGFSIAISWWWHGSPAHLSTLTASTASRVLVDFRDVDVNRDDYKNGTVHVSCPPREHNYYVWGRHRDGRRQEMEKCACDSTSPALNCGQLAHHNTSQEHKRQVRYH